MNKRNDKIKRILCFLTCGHRYRDADIEVSEDLIKRVLHVKHKCCKCGKVFKDDISIDKLFTSKERQLLGYDKKSEG